MTSLNNIKYFLDNFKGYDGQTALIWHNASYTYSQLLERIVHWRNTLEDFSKGTIVGLESDFSPETIAVLFALIEKNVIVVPLDINHSNKNSKKIEIAQLDFLIKVIKEDEINITKIFPIVDDKNNLYKQQDLIYINFTFNLDLIIVIYILVL